MNESNYAAKFANLAATEPKLYTLRGATLLVEVLPKEDITTESGIIISSGNNQRANATEFQRGIGLVLLQGDGYSDGTPMDINVGMVVIMPYNPMYLSQWPGLKGYTQNSLALISEGDVLFAYKSYEDCIKAKEVFRG